MPLAGLRFGPAQHRQDAPGGTGGLHIGVAINHIDGMDDLIRRADEHMYERRTDT